MTEWYVRGDAAALSDYFNHLLPSGHSSEGWKREARNKGVAPFAMKRYVSGRLGTSTGRTATLTLTSSIGFPISSNGH